MNSELFLSAFETCFESIAGQSCTTDTFLEYLINGKLTNTIKSQNNKNLEAKAQLNHSVQKF